MTRSLAARAAVVVHILLLALIAALLPTQAASANPDDPVEAPPVVETSSPSVTVTPSTGLRVGDTVTVTGTGFAPEDHPGVVGTRPPLPGDYPGVYVAIGTFLESWRPSEGAPASARAADGSQTKWFVRADQVAIVGAARGGVALEADGSFEITFTVPGDFTGALDDGRLGVYTYAGSGAVYAPFETETLLDLAQPTLEVSQMSELDPDGAELTITGRDYDARSVALYPPGNTNAAGVYLQIGWLDETWRPSEGAPSSARSNAESRWVQGVQETVPYLKWTEHDEGTADFEWTVTITKAELDAVARDGATLAVFTIGAGGVTQPANELAVPIAFATPNAPQEPQQPQEPGAEATPGSLLWGIKASFRDYVTGPIAHGSISVTGGAGVEGGRYWFPQASSSVDPETRLGSVAYRGSVRFTGHGGQLSVVVGDPVITITDAGRASLTAVGAGGRVTLATLQLSAGSRTVDATGAVTYSAVPATLTGAGAVAFAGFYNAGAALDPVSFTVGAANSASGVGGVVAAAARETAANTPAPTPPATNGITISGDLVAGGEITATASGFEPDETGILVVIYSDPVVLATDAAADASGTVTWTGRLPAGLTGEHTLTFQGSVDRGAVLDIAAAEVVGCEVAGAELEWGFKEEFRAYIDGSIANGEWTTADGATYETPLFRWEAGTGGYDAEAEAGDLTFTGSVRFTGHGGILDTTIANPRVVIGGDEGVLLLDVTGTTRDGEPVSAEGVEFAELDLGAAERVGGGDLIAFVDIPATLTTAGSAAFGTYEPRSALDPITLQITTSSDCGLPAVVEDAHPEPEPEPVAQGFPWVWILVAIGVLLVLAVIALLALRSRRA